MSFDVTTLALAKSYADQHGGSGGSGNTIYIPATLNISGDSGDSVAVETSTTIEQIDIAYRSGQELMLKLFVDDSGENAYLLPLVAAIPGAGYYFETLVSEQGILIVARDTGWSYAPIDFTPAPKEEIVNDVLAALPTWTGGSY